MYTKQNNCELLQQTNKTLNGNRLFCVLQQIRSFSVNQKKKIYISRSGICFVLCSGIINDLKNK